LRDFHFPAHMRKMKQCFWVKPKVVAQADHRLSDRSRAIEPETRIFSVELAVDRRAGAEDAGSVGETFRGSRVGIGVVCATNSGISSGVESACGQIYIKVELLQKSLAADPPFKAFLRKMNLPE
jgi:hypothetical protein